MAKIAPVSWRALVRVFELDGWIYDRTLGDHVIYVKSGYARPVVIPKEREVQVFIIMNNLRTARIPRDRYFHLLRTR